MIIQTGMRTDIPAFYSKWFINRIKDGYVLVRNPYNPNQVTKYILNPNIVDLIGFCTKNPGPMLKYMNLIDKYGQYWFVTITPYDKEIEQYVPPIEKVTDDFIQLSKTVGIDNIAWRYDPIFISNKYSISKHLYEFEKMCIKLTGYTNTCIISFIDIYSKVAKNFPEVKEISKNDRIEIGKNLINIADKYGIKIKPCAEGNELEKYGADCSGCMTVETYEKALKCKLDIPNLKNARNECSCYLSCDIGTYNTCGHNCKYCYANYSRSKVIDNMKQHDPTSPLLIGYLDRDDKIHEAKQISWKNNQLSLFD